MSEAAQVPPSCEGAVDEERVDPNGRWLDLLTAEDPRELRLLFALLDAGEWEARQGADGKMRVYERGDEEPVGVWDLKDDEDDVGAAASAPGGAG